MNDFQKIIRTISFLCLSFAALALIVGALDAFHPFPLADYLARKFGDAITLFVGAIAGLIAGHQFGGKTARREKPLREDMFVR
jgi:hypothetical protein